MRIRDLADTIISGQPEKIATEQDDANFKVLLARAEATVKSMIERGEIPNDVNYFLAYRDKLLKGEPISTEPVIGNVDVATTTTTIKPNTQDRGYADVLMDIINESISEMNNIY